MMQSHPDATAYPDAHKLASKGVVPGYAGHVPRARDTFGSTHVGGLAPEPHVGAHKKMGAMAGHAEPVPWEKDYDWETQVHAPPVARWGDAWHALRRGVRAGVAGVQRILRHQERGHSGLRRLPARRSRRRWCRRVWRHPA